MTKILRLLIIVLTLFLLIPCHAQTQKIKVKKDINNDGRFKNDTCDFNVIISKEIVNKKLVLHSFDMDDSYEREVGFSVSFRPVLSYLEQNIDVNTKTMHTILMDVCKINTYKLKTALVTEHKTTNPKYKNRIDIFLTYSK